MKKENEYFFNVRLNLKKADHRRAYNRLMNRHSQSISDCVVDALCFMDESHPQVLQSEQLQAAVRKELRDFFQDWKPPETMTAAVSGVTGKDSAPTEDDLAAAMDFMDSL